MFMIFEVAVHRSRNAFWLLLLCLALLALPVCSLQAQELSWVRQLGGDLEDDGQSVAVDAAGNVYVAGNLGAQFFGPFDFFVAKFDSAGNPLWQRQLGGTSFGSVYDLAIDVNGNVYTTGSFHGTMDLDPGPAVSNVSAGPDSASFISKLDANGNFVWGQHFPGSSSRSLAVDGGGNVYITGNFFGAVDFDPSSADFTLTAIGAGDLFVLKLSSFGYFVWAQQMGGEGSEMGLGITVDFNGYVLTTGDFVGGTVDFDPGPGVFNLTPVEGPPGGADIFVSKLNSDGDFVWARQMGGSDSDSGWGIAADSAGNVLTTGRFDGVADFDPGDAVHNLTSAGNEDIFVSKLDAAGNFVWARRIGGPDIESSYDLAVSANGSVFTTGLFRRTVDFDPGSGVFNLSALSGNNLFLSKLDSAGNFVWAQQIAQSSPFGAGIAVAGGNVYATGYFGPVSDFDPEGGGFQLTSNGKSDAFIAKYTDVTSNVLRPQISDGGIVLATLLPKVETVSALSIISVFGEHFTDETILYPNLRENGKIYYTLGGVCLTMNGEPLPIFAVTPGQVNAHVSNLHGLGPATFVAVSNCGTAAALSSAPVTLDVRRALASDGTMATLEEATPGFFVFDPVTSDGFIAARFNATEQQAPVPVAPAGLFPDDSYGPSRPAKPGDIILLFGTGWGPTEAFGSAGYPILEAAELSPEANPTVSFGGAVMAPEDVLYVGVSPGYAGLYQLAIRVPQTAQPGNNQVVLTVYGKSTPTGPVVPVAIP